MQNWNNPQSKEMTEYLHDLKKDAPLKPRIQSSLTQLTRITSLLDFKIRKINEKDSKISGDIVTTKKNHDLTKGRALANELVELRKNKKNPCYENVSRIS
jgi:hypothetical protein